MRKLIRKLQPKTELWMCEVHNLPMAYSWCDQWWHCLEGFMDANCTQLPPPNIMEVKGGLAPNPEDGPTSISKALGP